MIETILFSMVMVPLLIFSIWLGKLADLRLQTESAARQLAFECTVRGPECLGTAGSQALSDEIRVRGFTSRAGPLQSDSAALRQMASGAATGLVATDHRGRSLLARYDDVSTRVTPSRFDAGLSQALGQAGRTMTNAAQTLSGISGPDHFGLALTGGLAVAQVEAMSSARAAPAPGLGANPLSGKSSPAHWMAGGWREGIDPWPVRLQARAAILTDPWAASMPNGRDAQSVEQRLVSAWQVPSIGGVPADAMLSAWSQPARLLLNGVHAIGLEPSADKFRYHQIDWDRVPVDRLGVSGSKP